MRTYNSRGCSMTTQGTQQPTELLGETCLDGGKCHHRCEQRCFRRECCSPFSTYSGPWAYEHPGTEWAEAPSSKARQDQGEFEIDGIQVRRNEVGDWEYLCEGHGFDPDTWNACIDIFGPFGGSGVERLLNAYADLLAKQAPEEVIEPMDTLPEQNHAFHRDAGGWINVADRLPKRDAGTVWCYGTYEGQHAVCGFEGLYRDGKWFCLNNGDYIDGGYGADYQAKVAFWMPLPSEPNEDTKGADA